MRRTRGNAMLIAAGILLAACAAQPEKTQEQESAPQQAATPPKPDLGIEWVRRSAEYKAEAMQAYNAATEDLDELVANKDWSALPSQVDEGANSFRAKPAAAIFDIDETVVDNVEFQAQLVPPFSEAKFDAWHEANNVPEVPGARAFVERAVAAGVEVFFITNRSCDPPQGSAADPCPQKRITLDDLREAGIPFKPENVLLSDAQPGWTQEKEVRRNVIAAKHRVIMLFGDDLGDFLPCVRKRVYEPCTQPATRASRQAAIEKHGKYWGEGWYILPNPMYGSWTSVE